MVGKVSSVYVLAHSGFVIRCCPMADSKLSLELIFLHILGGFSLTVLLFFLIACRNMLLYSVCYPLRSASYLSSFTSARKFINYSTFLGGRNAIFLADGSITLVL